MQTPQLPERFFPISSPELTLRAAGGKALNLSRLARAGFNVPDGFVVPTSAYEEYVAHNELAPIMARALLAMDPASVDDLAAASAAIHQLFLNGSMPAGLAEDLASAWLWLGAGPVAVRSSATAEDLPGLSFAGQQDTFLNVIGKEALQEAVVGCWASLWTARAIGYRQRNQIAHDDVALAVVVQRMVQSAASGVLFTANPLTGSRRESVIDATLGLGEALVGGHVEPDHYVVNTASAAITHKFIGRKSFVISSLAGGDVTGETLAPADYQALPDDDIRQLAHIGAAIEVSFGFPQDIEWAWAGGELSILQSRPITSLFPLPDGLPAEPLKVFMSLGAVQGMLDPFTPLGRDALLEIVVAGGRLFDLPVTRASQTAVYEAGERLWINLTPLIKNPMGRRILPVVTHFVEPGSQGALDQLWADPDLRPGKRALSLGAARRLARLVGPVAGNVALNLARPQQRREAIVAESERMVADMAARCAAIKGDRWQRLSQQAELLHTYYGDYFLRIFPKYVSLVASGMVSWNLLNKLARSAAAQAPPTAHHGVGELAMQATRGMPHNPTTEMDLELWQVARLLRNDVESRAAFANNSAAVLAQHYVAGDLPPTTMRAVAGFLDQYGARGLAEIDLGRSRWAEDPTYVFDTLGRFMQIADERRAPDVVFAQGAASAEQAIAELQEAVRGAPGGWLKARLVPFWAGRMRQLMGARERPKFFAVRILWLIQRELMATGRDFVAHGELSRADDLFFLSLGELKSFAAHDAGDWDGLIADRRRAYAYEMRRRQVPRLLLSDGRAFYDGMGAAEATANQLSGSPVSPGSVEGRVRVVLDPTHAGLQPGEILVCPGTDPSWTPLFLSAAGLVMEVGGMMTHGAVVAREYGIPAVVGVSRVTERLRTGQNIRVNGSTGQIVVLDDLGSTEGDALATPNATA